MSVKLKKRPTAAAAPAAAPAATEETTETVEVAEEVSETAEAADAPAAKAPVKKPAAPAAKAPAKAAAKAPAKKPAAKGGLQLGEQTAPTQREIEEGARMPRDEFMRRFHAFLQDNNMAPPTLKQTTELVELFEEFMVDTTDAHPVKFMGGMFRIRNREGRVYETPNFPGKATYMPDHQVVTYRRELGAVDKIPGNIVDGEFVADE